MSPHRTHASVVQIAAVLLACIGCATHTGSVSSTNGANPSQSWPVELEPGLHIQPVASHAYKITHELPWPANSLLVEMANGTLVLAGTPYTPEATRHLLDWVRTRFGERQIVAINNGYHVDNLGGNAALLGAKIPVYGSDLTVRLLQERGEDTRQHVLAMIGSAASPTYKAHQRINYVPPDHVFPISEGLTLTFGNEVVRVLYAGPNQAPDKVVVHFPSQSLLYGGCMILGGDKLGNVAEADIDSWERAVRTLVELRVTVVVPGHGDRTDPNLIQSTLDVLAKSKGAEPAEK